MTDPMDDPATKKVFDDLANHLQPQLSFPQATTLFPIRTTIRRSLAQAA